MIRSIYIIVALFLTQNLYGQINLVPNPSFEDTINHNGNCVGQIEWAINWFNPTNSTPDLYTFSPASANCNMSSLNNPSGYQLPFSGFTYAGIFTYAGFTRDYIAIKLDSVLSNGCNYFVQFYVSQANNFGLATDKIGVSFVDDTTGFYLYNGNLPIVPVVESPPGIPIADTLNWIEIKGYFSANGNEQFMIIGNFYDDSNTLVDTSHFALYYSAYYYIDNVKVLDCISTSIIEKNNMDVSSFVISPNPTDGIIYIKSETIRIKNLDLLDLLGNTILSGISVSNNNPINLGDIAPGCYITKCYYDNGNQFFYSKIQIIK